MNYGVRYSTVQTSAPAAEPVSATEQKAHMGVTISTDDTLIGTQVAAARAYCEQVTGRQFITATWRLSLERFPDEIMLPYPPFGSLTSITYIDSSGTSQTMSSSEYEQDTDTEPSRIRPAWGYSWPSIRNVYRPVRVTYTAGYGAAGSSVPSGILSAIKAVAGTLYEFRETVISGTIVARIEEVSDYLLWPYRMGMTF
jgi:uncharacterized phiE125 gp8 family phage protein